MGTVLSKKLHSLISYITHETNDVFWIKSEDFQSQIYISPNYETKWLFNCAQMYQKDLTYWYQTILPQDLAQPSFSQAIKQRKNNLLKAENCFLIRMQQSNQNILHVLDHSYVLYQPSGKPVIAGIAQIFQPSQWQDAWHKDWESLNGMVRQDMYKDILSVLSEDLNWQSTPPAPTNYPVAEVEVDKKIFPVYTTSGKQILSHREAACLHYLLQGKSAKQIARMLSLSSRTIESYIAHLKIKLNCKKTLALVNAIKNLEAILA